MPQMNQDSNGRADFQALTQVMEAASELRRKRQDVDIQLNIDEVREDMRERIMQATAHTGEKLDDETVNAAIDNYFEGLYRFREPANNWQTRVAEAYVDRVKLGKKYGIPAAALLMIGGIAFGSVKGISSAYRHSLESKVEARVQEAYTDRTHMLDQIAGLESWGSSLPRSESGDLKSIVSTSKSIIHGTDPFFREFCSEGTAKDDITQENYETAEAKLASVAKTLDSARVEMGRGVEIVETHNKKIALGKSLESLMGEVESRYSGSVFAQKARAAYDSGIVSLNNRQLADAERYTQELRNIKSDAEEFITLVPRANELRVAIENIAKDPEAKVRAGNLYHEVSEAAKVIDMDKLRESVKGLNSLNYALSQTYELRIVSRDGVKSGIDRYYTDERGRRASGYYLILEAVDSQGQALPVPIRNEESGRTETVSMWGERVPQEVYEKVKADKLDNGRVDNQTYGVKQRGYLAPRITFRDPRGGPVPRAGQITQW